MNVKIKLYVEVDPAAWDNEFGPVEVDLVEDVRRYVAGLVSSAEATRRGAFVGVDVAGRPVRPRGDY